MSSTIVLLLAGAVSRNIPGNFPQITITAAAAAANQSAVSQPAPTHAHPQSLHHQQCVSVGLWVMSEALLFITTLSVQPEQWSDGLHKHTHVISCFCVTWFPHCLPL